MIGNIAEHPVCDDVESFISSGRGVQGLSLVTIFLSNVRLLPVIELGVYYMCSGV